MPTLHAVITKVGTFRGKPERWSNGYNFQTGEHAITDVLCDQVCTALRTMEASFLSSECSIPYLLAGPLGEDAIYSYEAADGVGLHGSWTGEAKQLELCSLAQSKIGPKRYLMKYYHASKAIGDALDGAPAGPRGEMNDALAKLTDGTMPSGLVYCRPNGALATAPFTIDPYVRVHQLKRRGKRP